jgi:hypothetical protein
LVNLNYSLQKIDYTLSFFLNAIAFSYHQGKRTVNLIREFWDTLYILKPGKEKISQQIYSTKSIIDKTVADHILFLHAFSGCDTTSALFNQGKMKFINVLRKNPDLNEIIQVFKNPNANPEIIAKAGERVLLELYSYSNVKSKKVCL